LRLKRCGKRLRTNRLKKRRRDEQKRRHRTDAELKKRTHAKKTDEEIAKLEDLAKTISDSRDINEETLILLRKNQNFAKHPDLALAHFHCCSNHPYAFVFDDEQLNAEEEADVCARLPKVLDLPPGQDEVIRWVTWVWSPSRRMRDARLTIAGRSAELAVFVYLSVQGRSGHYRTTSLHINVLE